MVTKEKVVAYIFRNNRNEILVFDHMVFPEVSPQVPAGTIEFGEKPQQAMIREIYEESGLKFSIKELKYLGRFSFKNARENQIRFVYLIDSKDNNKSIDYQNIPDHWQHKVSSSDADNGLIFKYYWLSVKEAETLLKEQLGKYLLYCSK